MVDPASQEASICVRDYRDTDESAWVACRLRAFLDSSYRDDVQQHRERYRNPAVRLVAEHMPTGELVGFLDIEYESSPGQVCNFPDARGGVIWHLGVVPEYRRAGIATLMWEKAQLQLIAAGVSRVQAWSQDDEPASRWYRDNGFAVKSSYLNVYVRGLMGHFPLKKLLPISQGDWQYGHVRSFNFEAPIEDRAKLEPLSYRMHEVREYERTIGHVAPKTA